MINPHMKNRQKFENKLATLRKVFHRRCLFYEQVIESSHFPRRENQTLLSTCEFCFAKYEVLKEGKELETISKLFPIYATFAKKRPKKKKK